MRQPFAADVFRRDARLESLTSRYFQFLHERSLGVERERELVSVFAGHFDFLRRINERK